MPTVSSNPEVASHYAVQAGLSAKLAAALAQLGLPEWQNPGSLQDYLASVAAVTNEFSSASISLSADFYEAMREQAGVTDAFTVPINEPWNVDSIESYLDAATQRLLADIDAEVANGAELEAQIESEAARLVLDAGRYEVITAAETDRKARGWARVARPGACSFCRLLASRGPVYRSEKSASFQSHTRFNGKGGDCRCVAEPVFGQYEPTAQARADASLLSEVSEKGMTSAQKRNAFRRALAEQTSR